MEKCAPDLAQRLPLDENKVFDIAKITSASLANLDDSLNMTAMATTLKHTTASAVEGCVLGRFCLRTVTRLTLDYDELS